MISLFGDNIPSTNDHSKIIQVLESLAASIMRLESIRCTESAAFTTLFTYGGSLDLVTCLTLLALLHIQFACDLHVKPVLKAKVAVRISVIVVWLEVGWVLEYASMTCVLIEHDS